ncbi:MAG: hypothetical protein ACD_46C00044G0007, partial [uncultured bacterium]
TDSILTPKKQLTAAVPSESKKPGIPVSWVVGGALFGIAVATIVIGVSIFTGGAAIPAVVGAGAAIATFVTGSTASAITAAIVGGVALTAGAAAAGSILGMAAKGIKQTFSWFKEKFFGPKEEVKKQVPTESTAISPNNIGPAQKTTAQMTNALKSQPHESHDHKQDKQEQTSIPVPEKDSLDEPKKLEKDAEQSILINDTKTIRGIIEWLPTYFSTINEHTKNNIKLADKLTSLNIKRLEILLALVKQKPLSELTIDDHPSVPEARKAYDEFLPKYNETLQAQSKHVYNKS